MGSKTNAIRVLHVDNRSNDLQKQEQFAHII